MTGTLSAQNNTTKVEGSVIGTKGEVIGFATAVLLRADSSQVTAAVSDKDGLFSLNAPKGKYIFKVGCLGYADHFEQMEIKSATKLAPIKLEAQSIDVGAVSVTTKYITREADRFVMNVAGSSEAIGNTAYDMLTKAPGVWISNETISINGFSGTKVMIGERILDMPFDELKVYLASIKAEDIQKIEVVPIAGADFDASSKGGIIKITLRRQRQDGIDGNVSMSYETDRIGGYDISPSATINYRSGKLSLYANGNYSNELGRYSNVGINDYIGTPNRIESQTSFTMPSDYYRLKAGMIYDFNEKRSFGAEVSYSDNKEDETTSGVSNKYNASTIEQRESSLYNGHNTRQSLYATVNYIYKIDTTGKMLKLIGDYNLRKGDNNTQYNNTLVRPALPNYDSLYRHNSDNTYNIFAFTANLELPLDKRTTIKTGAKFSLNNMASSQLYEGFYPAGDEWLRNEQNSLENKYNEYIGALYVIGSTKFFNKLSVSAGLRGEYTYAKPQTELLGESSSKQVGKQNYFKLFPNVNVSLPLDKKNMHSLALNYSKTISRPWFGSITPFRKQLSEYSYIEGNPALKPTIEHSTTLTYILSQKYSLSFGAQIENDPINQVSRVDETDPKNEVIATRFENMKSNYTYFASLNAPFTITKWWSASINATALHQSITYNDITRKQLTLQTNASTTVTLPAKFIFEASAFYMTKAITGNIMIEPMLYVDAALKKRIAKDKVTLSVSVDNIFDRLFQTKGTMTEPSFTQNIHLMQDFRSVQFSVRYNFKSGIKFNVKQVEQGNEEGSKRAGK